MEGSGTTLIVPFVFRLLVFHCSPLGNAGKFNLVEDSGKLPVEQLERVARLRHGSRSGARRRESPARTNCPVTLIWSYWLPATGPANCITVLVELPR